MRVLINALAQFIVKLKDYKFKATLTTLFFILIVYGKKEYTVFTSKAWVSAVYLHILDIGLLDDNDFSLRNKWLFRCCLNRILFLMGEIFFGLILNNVM